MKEMKDFLAKYEAMLPVGGSLSMPEAERRAGEFLSAQATIANWRHILSDDKVRLMSVQTAVYAEQMVKGTSKTVTENKLLAEASEEYTKAREEYERMENDLSYLKTYSDIFMAAHVFYRNICKSGEFG